MTLMNFGAHKGRMADTLSDAELAASIAEGHRLLVGNGWRRWARAVSETVQGLEAEQRSRRTKGSGGR